MFDIAHGRRQVTTRTIRRDLEALEAARFTKHGHAMV
jgi:DeoR/GlpR family transcriptional regulator of sugar metabolism